MKAAGSRALVFALLSCCAREPDVTSEVATPDPIEEAVARLRAFEQRQRAATDFAQLPSAAESLGADPYALVPLSDERAVGILRGGDEVVLYDRALKRRDAVTWPSPTGVAVCADRIHVVGELSGSVEHLSADGDRLAILRGTRVPGAVALRDVACSGASVYAVDEATDQIAVLRPDGVVMLPTCEGPVAVDVVGDRLVVRCIIDHTVLVHRLDSVGWPEPTPEVRVQHDGPIWGAAMRGDTLALGGVENRPLDRTEGFFGHVDSFVFLYRDGRPLAQRNVSADGVVTPKALLWQGDKLIVSGYGSAGAVVLDGSLNVAERRAQPPGSASMTRFAGALVAANPLLDAWVIDGERIVPERAPVDAAQRFGEALAFTTLMAPKNPVHGPHSRFTCETCHFEGYGDGRTHHTGRGDVRATTKPLYGLFNNRPHFTRALDPDLTKVAHAEFRVAGKGSGHDPWFELRRVDHPWLAHLIEGEVHGPEAQREALMRFLMAFNHRPNPVAYRTTRFAAEHKRGGEIFSERCVECHAARLSTDDEATEIPLARWEGLILAGGPIVWARPGYEKTGVTPYVHDDGARPSSLRRLYRKRPYFSNGSARTLEALLAGVGWTEAAFFHAGAPAAAVRLSADEQKALASFLRLL